MNTKNPPASKAELKAQRLRELRDVFADQHRARTVSITCKYGRRGARRIHAFVQIGTSSLSDVTRPMATAMGYKTNTSDGSLTIRGTGFAVVDLLREYFPMVSFEVV